MICLTADAVQGARERYLEEGFTDYLTKPVDGIALETAMMAYLPAEKVIRATEAETGPAAAQVPGEQIPRNDTTPDGAQTGGTLQQLYESVEGLHFDEAMQYSASEDILKKTLTVFYDTLPEKIEEISRFYEQGDYDNFTIKVHALKSGARMVGATEISELARQLEASGDIILKARDSA